MSDRGKKGQDSKKDHRGQVKPGRQTFDHEIARVAPPPPPTPKNKGSK